MERKEPWITEPAIALLELFLSSNKNCRILETGMGASTLYFERHSRFLKTIEHDGEWYNKIAALIFGSNPQQAISTDQGLTIDLPFISFNLYNRPYNAIIDKDPDNYYDLVFIDGRDRVKCIKSSIPKLKPGGWLVLDNSERPYYQAGMDLMKTWKRIDCDQPLPDKYGFTYPDWKTSIFIKP